MRNKLATLAAALGILVPVSAQAQSSQVYIEQVPSGLADGKLEGQLIKKPAETSPRPAGPLSLEYELTKVPQPGLNGGNNESTVIQNGNGNDAEVDIKGGRNKTIQLQNGDGNRSDVNIQNGHYNFVTVAQNGANHSSDINLTNTVGQAVVNIQSGSGQTYSLTRSGNATVTPIVVIQHGHR